MSRSKILLARPGPPANNHNARGEFCVLDPRILLMNNFI